MILGELLSVTSNTEKSILVNGDEIRKEDIAQYYNNTVSGIDCYNGRMIIFVNTNIENIKILNALNSIASDFRGSVDRYERGDVEKRVLEVYSLLGDEYIRRAVEIAKSGRVYNAGRIGNRLAVKEMLNMVNSDIATIKTKINIL